MLPFLEKRSEQVRERAQSILGRSGLLVKENCHVIGPVVYERLYDHPEGVKYRVFFSADDYDYVESGSGEEKWVDRFFGEG